MSVRVKICGLTRLVDAQRAVEYGADALGFNFWPESKRYCPPARAALIISQLPPFVTTVGIFVNQTRAHIRAVAKKTGIDVVQLHGDETPEFCARLGLPVVKAIRVDGAGALGALGRFEAEGFLLDAPSSGYGGSGTTFDWRLARKAARKHSVILAGGLTPENVSAAVQAVRPFAVDVASGVEAAPGQKDKKKLLRFIRNAKESMR